MTQRDMMRKLVRTYGTDWDRICSEYARAEASGAVRRNRNTYALSGEQYGRALFRDGQRKGWL
jgi:hypothetical protein